MIKYVNEEAYRSADRYDALESERLQCDSESEAVECWLEANDIDTLDELNWFGALTICAYRLSKWGEPAMVGSLTMTGEDLAKYVNENFTLNVFSKSKQS